MAFQLSQDTEKRLAELTPGMQTLIVYCTEAFRYGGYWGLVNSKDSEYVKIVKTLKTIGENVALIQLNNGALVLADTVFLANTINHVIPNIVNDKVITLREERKAKELQKFSKFVDNVLTGKSTKIKKVQDHYELVVGVFSTNETNNIRHNGSDYPSYKLTMSEVIYELQRLESLGLTCLMKAVDSEDTTHFLPIAQLIDSGEGLKALYRGLEISDSQNGAFLTVLIK